MTVDVGADIESICGKCGDVWHVVVAKVEGDVAKVQCKECGGRHKHKPPKAKKKKRATTTRKKKAPAPPPGPTIEPDLSRPIRDYSISEAYQAGDRVQHPTFGLGVVEGKTGPGKMHVFFPEGGRKLLAQARPVSQLERPARRSDEI